MRRVALRALSRRLSAAEVPFPFPYRTFYATGHRFGKVVPFKLADIGEGILKATVTQWHVASGDTVRPFDPLCEVESDKAVVTIPSPYNGVVRRLYVDKGADAFVGKPLVDIEVEGSAPAAAPTEPSKPPSTPPAADTPKPGDAPRAAGAPTGSGAADDVRGLKTLATPAVRRVAKENEVDIAKVRGSGKDGRVLKEDVLAYLSGPSPATATPSQSQLEPSAAAAPKTTAAAADRVIPLTSGVRKAMVRSMTLANQIPAFGASEEIEFDELIRSRDVLRKVLQDRGMKDLKLTFMPFMMKAASLGLLQYPELNAHTNEDCTELVVKASHNVGCAIDTPKGLIVPNVKDCQAKSVLEIATDLAVLVEKGQKGTLSVGDLQGTTFTISNIGSIGATVTRPVINPPQVCMVAIGRGQKLPRFGPDGEVRASTVVVASYSADHRVLDGATVVRHSNLFKFYLETPSAMLLDLR